MSAHTHYVQVDRYEEYPKMRELIQRKDSLVAQRATPAFFMQVNYPAFPPSCLDPCARPALSVPLLMLLPTKIPSLSAATCMIIHASVPAG